MDVIANLDKLTEHGCGTEKKDKVCRSRGGESCAFDGAMIVLQPIADAAHLVHGPIACCGNSWEGRGTRSRVRPHGRTLSHIPLYRMGFTTDMGEMDIVYGSEAKLARAIRETFERVAPKAIFVHATCVSGLIGEDIDAVCRKAEEEIGVPVIPVNAPGFVGPKNLGNRIAGEVLLDKVIGTGQPPCATPYVSLPQVDVEGVGIDRGRQVSVNLIGEYNIAGDLWLVEPVLKRAGLSVLSRLTGDATFEEITWAHHAQLNVVVCSRALINVAKGMEQKYGIPYVEVSFFGKTEMAKALRLMGSSLDGSLATREGLRKNIEEVIADEERMLQERLKSYAHLKGKKAVLYTGGVKSWSFISALRDLGIEIVAVGTKKSTHEDEEKMRELLGPDAPLVEDVTPKNLKRLLSERKADVLIAGGRNQYLAIKEGYPFVDVNQERHLAYAGYEGLVNLAEQISAAIRFYEKCEGKKTGNSQGPRVEVPVTRGCSINPLKHSPSVGAAMAFQGIHNALPVIHGAQGCTFLAKVLLTKHFREPIALAGTKLFAEDVVMGSEEALARAIRGFIDKDRPDVIGVLTSGLTEVKGDDVSAIVKSLDLGASASRVLYVPTPDYEGGLESGYAGAVESLISLAAPSWGQGEGRKRQITVLAGCHLTPADFLDLRECVESFGLT
ncbi:MAG TPA: nitrogenase iron-molybdenum cofactor biosynthesis protein NifE, partial [Dissulfurispiraceae bacterium]|nr:nitrogenase iron-molybdenum cofactor biosynthesis protein NifE [Dissulfurispiraceae bacterium]